MAPVRSSAVRSRSFTLAVRDSRRFGTFQGHAGTFRSSGRPQMCPAERLRRALRPAAMSRMQTAVIADPMAALTAAYPSWHIWRSRDTRGRGADSYATRRRRLTAAQAAAGLRLTLSAAARRACCLLVQQQVMEERLTLTASASARKGRREVEPVPAQRQKAARPRHPNRQPHSGGSVDQVARREGFEAARPRREDPAPRHWATVDCPGSCLTAARQRSLTSWAACSTSWTRCVPQMIAWRSRGMTGDNRRDRGRHSR